MTDRPHVTEIRAGEGAEISVTNQDFTFQETGLETLAVRLDPDLYTVTIRVANHSTEHDLIVKRGGDLRVTPMDDVTISNHDGRVLLTVEQPQFATASPLRGTSRSHEIQGDFVALVSNRLHGASSTSRSSEVLISARAFGYRSKSTADLGVAVSVLDRDNKVVADLYKDGEHLESDATDPMVACSMAVSPGWYRLKIERRDHPAVEQSLMICAGWQTQVFVLREEKPRDRMRISVMMEAIEKRQHGKLLSQPDASNRRMTELALLGLARGRRVVTDAQLDKMLDQKFADPMLGIYGAHLVEEKDTRLLGVVVQNLRRMIGVHPDVEALALRVPELAATARIELPPMLTAGWRNIVSRSVRDPDVVPRGSLNASIAPRLYGAGVWLWWAAGDPPRSTARPVVASALAMAPPASEPSRDQSALATVIRTPPNQELASSPGEAALLRVIPIAASADDTEGSIIESLCMPRVMVEDLAAGLLARQSRSSRDVPPKTVGPRWCFTWVPKIKGRDRAALLNESRWPVGSIITVGFLDGERSLQQRVAEVAQMWTAPGLANLKFVFKQDPADCFIRISFQYEGSWSVVGTQCLSPLAVPAGQATMNYGWLTSSSSDDEVRAVVLHEFGHALGMLHEHQSPKAKIQWNKQQVYQDLSGPPNNWDKATIDFNMFDKEPASAVTATSFDTSSIMQYSFPASWTSDGFSTEPNSVLSTRDRKLIRALYP